MRFSVAGDRPWVRCGDCAAYAAVDLAAAVVVDGALLDELIGAAWLRREVFRVVWKKMRRMLRVLCWELELEPSSWLGESYSVTRCTPASLQKVLRMHVMPRCRSRR